MVDPSWMRRAIEITSGFEGATWDTVVGNFDGQGLSCGAMQQNLGQGTLQALIRGLSTQTIIKHMPKTGAEFCRLCRLPIAEAFRGIANMTSTEDFFPELKSFLSSPDGIAVQLDSCRAVGEKAYRLADKWRKGDPLTLQTFCWFFDLLVQSGGLKGLWIETTNDYISLQGGMGSTKSHIFAEFASSQNSDLRKNVILWSQTKFDDNLFVLSYLRAKQSRKEFQQDAMNRRGTLCAGHGWVHGVYFNLKF